MLLDNSARQQRTLIQITQMADSNELVQVTQTDFILRQNNNMVTADFTLTLSRSIGIFRINGIVLRLAVADKITLHAENQLPGHCPPPHQSRTERPALRHGR